MDNKLASIISVVMLAFGLGIGFLVFSVFGEVKDDIKDMASNENESPSVFDTAKLEDENTELKRKLEEAQNNNRLKDDAIKLLSQPVEPKEEVEKEPLIQDIPVAQLSTEDKAKLAEAAIAIKRASELEKANGDLEAELKAYRENKNVQAIMADGNSLKGIQTKIEALEPDWPVLSDAAKTINKLAVELYKDFEAGKPMNMEVATKLGLENQKLVKFAVRAMGVLPSQSDQVNAGFSHPIVTVSLMRQALSKGNEAFSEEQETTLERMGQSYLDDYTDAVDKLGSEATMLERTGAEYKERLKFADNVRENVLNEKQRALLWHAETEGVQGMDIYSPAILFYGAVAVVDSANQVGYDEELKSNLQRTWQLSSEDVEAIKPHIQKFKYAMKPHIQTTPENLLAWWYEDEVVAGIDATVGLQKSILEDENISDEIKGKVKDAAIVLLARQVESEE